MIHANKTPATGPKQIRAVGLISGGLDSTIAAQIVKDLNVEIHGLFFAMPWGCCDKGKAQAAADNLNIPLVVLQLDERYLKIVERPKYGYGSVLNPCVDCRIHMFSRAAQYMHSIGADFVFTGEVLGQRLMSQLRKSMKWIEEESGLTGLLLRPLCAQLLEPTILEQEGLIDRARLLKITGRSRREQRALAAAHGITDYPNSAGGCLLTDKNFARKMQDTLTFGYRDFRETISLKWGRHFRINNEFKAIVGRDDAENNSLIHYAHADDFIFELKDQDGPTLVLKGDNPSLEILGIAASLVQRFSRYKDNAAVEVYYWPFKSKEQAQVIVSRSLSEEKIKEMSI